MFSKKITIVHNLEDFSFLILMIYSEITKIQIFDQEYPNNNRNGV